MMDRKGIFLSRRPRHGTGYLLLALMLMGLGAYAATSATPASATPASAAQAKAAPYDWTTWSHFWSFRPIVKPTPPAVKDASWCRNDVDHFVLAHLQAKGLTPAPEADKIILIRRASFDLTGLPPTPQEIRAFLADHSPDAYDKLIDRLLASPHYGERWGRHWLDPARYVQGRITFPGIKQTSGDQPYRDYVVRAFNSDKPYNQFITEQLAGDLLPPSPDPGQEMDQITAPAFLSIGAWFDQETDPNRLKLEMVDDMINTTTKAFLGLSVACARCHDHKFDPIPTADYYALGGIFNSTRLVGDFSEYWRDGRTRQLRPMAMPEQVVANDRIRQQLDEKKARRWKLLSKDQDRLLAQWKGDASRYRDAVARMPKPWVKIFEAEDFSGEHNLHIAQLSKDGKGTDVIETLTPIDQWVKYKIDVPDTGMYRLEALYCSEDDTPIILQNNGETVAQGVLTPPTGGWELIYQRWQPLASFRMRGGLNFVRMNAKEGNFPRIDRLRLYRIDDDFDGKVRAVAHAEKLHPLVLANFIKDPADPWPTVAGIEPYLDDADRKPVDALAAEADRLQATIQPYPLTIAVTDQTAPADIPIHLRGDTYQVSAAPVPRGVPHLLDRIIPRPSIPSAHSGRLELARWITDPGNPLTARVMANRIWQGHLGRGIVATPSDFGSRGDPPTHPELLDYLAATFKESGWSIKQMHRLIMTSSAYRMSGRQDDAILQADPDNHDLTRFAPRRLECEEIYDALLCTANKLVKQEPSAPLNVDKSKDRALYILTSGRSPAGLGVEIRKMFALFDYDASGAPIGLRPTSITPAQSLFWLNSPLAKYYADRFAARLLKMDRLSDPKRVEMAYLLALGHSPSKQATQTALDYLQQCQSEQGLNRQDAWAQFCRVLYSTTEFRYAQ